MEESLSDALEVCLLVSHVKLANPVALDQLALHIRVIFHKLRDFFVRVRRLAHDEEDRARVGEERRCDQFGLSCGLQGLETSLVLFTMRDCERGKGLVIKEREGLTSLVVGILLKGILDHEESFRAIRRCAHRSCL